MANEEFNEWRVSAAEFRGYMKSKIENIEEKLDSCARSDELQDIKIGKIENRLTATEIKGSIFGALGGIAGGFFAGLIRMFR
jgi:hypothetical protein